MYCIHDCIVLFLSLNCKFSQLGDSQSYHSYLFVLHRTMKTHFLTNQNSCTIQIIYNNYVLKTVLQIVKFAVKRIFKLTFRTVVLCQSECQHSLRCIHSDNRLQSEISVKKFFSLQCRTYLFVIF